MYSNQKVKLNISEHPIETVNCFTRSFALALTIYDESYSDKYILTQLFEQIYHPNITSNDIFDFNTQVVEKYFDIKAKTIYVENDIISSLESTMFDGVSIVPINLVEIYYSDYYKVGNWEHPLLVSGIDFQKQLFRIVDSTHIKKEVKRELNFVMKYEDLKRGFYSYFKNINPVKPKFLYYEPNEEENEYVGISSIVSKFLKYYKKVNIIFCLTNVSKAQDLLNLDKKIKFFFDMLLKFLKQDLLINERLLSDILDISMLLSKKVKKYTRLVIYNQFKGCKYINKKMLEEISVLDKLLWDNIKSISIMDNTELLKRNEAEIFENNEDNIISIHENCYEFTFNDKKTYNSWLSDECPKVVLGRGSYFELMVYLKISQNDNANFMAGIFLKVSQDLIFFGWDTNYGINADIKGKQGSISNIPCDLEEITLKAVKSTGIVSFFYLMGDKWNKLCDYDCKDNIIIYGIGCKTYYLPANCQIEISVI